MKQTWNKRNGQRATVKRPGTAAYHHDFENRQKQFYSKRVKSGCSRCGSSSVVVIGGSGKMTVYCASCGKLIKTFITRNKTVGNWSKQRIYRNRAGLCDNCGNGRFTGKMHVSSDNKKHVMHLTCTCCGFSKTTYCD